ncbi:hypothetical protein SVIOM342S_00480 [Streptomyces violaceorubidus]
MNHRTVTAPEPAAVPGERPPTGAQAELLRAGMDTLHHADPELAALLDAEVEQQNSTLAMVASARPPTPPSSRWVARPCRT